MFPEASSSDPAILTCWKEIAQYLGKGVRTVQRWERDLGLPVRRPNGINHKTAVIARTHDLDVWMESRWAMRNGSRPAVSAGPPEMASDLVLGSQELRNAYSSLLRTTSSEAGILKQHCSELALLRETAQALRSNLRAAALELHHIVSEMHPPPPFLERARRCAGQTNFN